MKKKCIFSVVVFFPVQLMWILLCSELKINGPKNCFLSFNYTNLVIFIILHWKTGKKNIPKTQRCFFLPTSHISVLPFFFTIQLPFLVQPIGAYIKCLFLSSPVVLKGSIQRHVSNYMINVCRTPFSFLGVQ